MATKTKATRVPKATPADKAMVDALKASIGTILDADGKPIEPTPAPTVATPAKVSHAYGTPGNTGTQRTRDGVQWGPNKHCILLAMVRAGCTDEATAGTTRSIGIEALGLSATIAGADGGVGKGWGWWCGHIGYNAAAAGLVAVYSNKYGTNRHGFAITPAGIAYLASHGVTTGKPVKASK